ncbi:tripartite motif-containing protein 71 [Mytilus galloprovincialis]|uniref:Tripartite motif-containing protein 71 n=1 Tax=Mytilus galloprovincialis TaxID=29158 RepID=A0A8B6CHC5_MYTGA|nr:tripartite motif-containing protein 71 [Mytilus galloprovincialis]
MAHGGGQVPVSCNLCEENTRIEWKCLNCDMLMCDKCKEKIHVKFKFAKDHKVVSIQEVGLHAEEVDFSSISCKNHSKQICFMFCKSCDCLVCPLCISETHNGHGLVAIKEGYEIHSNKLKTGQNNIKTKIVQLKKRKAEVKNIETTEHSRLENTLKKIETQKNVLKNEVDKHIENLKSKVMKRWEALRLTTKKEENEVTLLIGSLESQNSEVDEIIQSNDGKRVFVDGLGLVQLMEETVTPTCTKFDSIPIFLPGEITPYNIGSLENVSIKGDIKIIKEFTSEIPSRDIAACSEDTLWINDQNTIQKVKIEECRLKEIVQKEVFALGMACTSSKDLLFISGGSVLKQISDQTSEVTNSVYDVKSFLSISAVYVNPDGKVIVGALNGDLVYPAVGRRIVVVMDKSGKHENTYEYDRHGKPLFTYVWNITRTKNGNSCVVDRLSKDHRGRVVILSEDGDVLNTFSGNPEVNTEKKPFHPFRAFTTHSDNIAVSNLGSSILYILNSSGKFIQCCDLNKVGISRPYSFSVADSGHIFVGCTVASGSSDKAKIYEVNIS